MPLLTTGLIENTPVAGVRPTSTFSVLVSNNDINTVSVQITGFFVSGTTKTIYVLEFRDIPPGETTEATYYAQFDAFEFQFDTSNDLVVVSAWGKDEAGNLVAAHRVLPAELDPLGSTVSQPSLQGISAQLQGSPGEILADTAPVIFDTVVINLSPNITYDPVTGEFTISEAGNYYVTWWVTTDGSAGPVNMVFAVQVDSSPVSLGNSPIVTGQVNGDALIEVTATPTVVSLVNQTGADIVFANINVQANLTILSLGQ